MLQKIKAILKNMLISKECVLLITNMQINQCRCSKRNYLMSLKKKTRISQVKDTQTTKCFSTVKLILSHYLGEVG